MSQLPNDINYRALVEHIPAITYVAAWDDQSSTVYTSPQIERLLGFTQSEWMANNTLWLAQIHPDDRAWVREELERIHAGGEPARIEYRMLTCDGREVWFRDDASVARDAEGRPLYLYGVIFDITIEKRLEFEVADLRERIGGAWHQNALNISLTDRELEVLRLLAACWTNAKISATLHISPKTVVEARRPYLQEARRGLAHRGCTMGDTGRSGVKSNKPITPYGRDFPHRQDKKKIYN